MAMKIGIQAWIDFAFRKIFGKPGNEICLISLLNAVLQFPYPVVSVQAVSLSWSPFAPRKQRPITLFCRAKGDHQSVWFKGLRDGQAGLQFER
jgi:hypothetical protein